MITEIRQERNAKFLADEKRIMMEVESRIRRALTNRTQEAPSVLEFRQRTSRAVDFLLIENRKKDERIAYLESIFHEMSRNIEGATNLVRMKTS